MRVLAARPLTREAFAPYGEVIAKAGAEHFDINDGMATRYHDLAPVEAAKEQGRPLINIFEGRPWALPLTIRMLERHNLGSQAFFPLRDCRWLVVVAPAGDFDPAGIEAFVADGAQGVNYRPGTWHHPLVALDGTTDFLVVDRGGPAVDCDEAHLAEDELVRVEA